MLSAKESWGIKSKATKTSILTTSILKTLLENIRECSWELSRTFESLRELVLRTFENFRDSRMFLRSFFKILVFKILVLFAYNKYWLRKTSRPISFVVAAAAAIWPRTAPSLKIFGPFRSCIFRHFSMFLDVLERWRALSSVASTRRRRSQYFEEPAFQSSR